MTARATPLVCCAVLLTAGPAIGQPLPVRHAELYAIDCPAVSVPASYALDAEGEARLGDYARARLLCTLVEDAPEPTWPLATAAPYGVHVAVRAAGRIIGEGIGLGGTLQANLDDAMRRAVAIARRETAAGRGAPLTADTAARATLEVSLFYDSEPLERRLLTALRQDIDPERHGAGLWVDGRLALAPQAMWLRSKQTHRQFLQTLSQAAGQPGDAFRRDYTRLYRFDTVHLVQGDADATTVRLIRGDRFVPITAVTPTGVRAWLASMADWLLRQVADNGRLAYMYHPDEDRDDTNNNMIRQWMATHALGAWHADSGDPRFADAYARNVAWNMRHYYRDYEMYGVIEYRDTAKLGAAACAMMALMHAPRPAEHATPLEQLKKLLLHLRQPDGSFKTHLFPPDLERNTEFYSGEALLALAMYLERHPADQSLREIVAAGRDHYMPWYRASGRTAAFIPWHTMAYWRMYQLTADPAYRDAIFEMNDWLICLQDLDAGDRPDTAGRFYVETFREQGQPHASATAIYVEGLAHAYDLARRTGSTERAEAYLEAIHWGTRSLMQLQYRPENSLFIPNPARALGGIRSTVLDNRLRCDNTQHAVMAALAILRFIDGEALVAPTPRARPFRARCLERFTAPATPPAGATLILGGDTQLARDTERTVRERGPARALAAIGPLLGGADALLVNLECVVAASGIPADKGEERPFHFRAAPATLDVFPDDVRTIVSIANNHSMDYGAPALLEMIESHLPARGIVYAGGGRDALRAASPGILNVGGLRLAVFSFTTLQPQFQATADAPGYNWISETDLDACRRQLRATWAAAPPSDLQILAIHWGRNYDQTASDMHREMAHAAVELGFDLVVGHHAHVFQGIEVHDGVPIFYDLGNFLVDFHQVGWNLKSIMPVLEVDAGGVRRIEIVPIALAGQRVAPAPPVAARAILHKLTRLSSRYGTQIITRDDRGEVILRG